MRVRLEHSIFAQVVGRSNPDGDRMFGRAMDMASAHTFVIMM